LPSLSFLIIIKKEVIMKKIIFFIIGFFLIPTALGSATAYLFNPENYETYIGFWGSIYLIVYVTFPFIFRGKIKQFTNKYTLYTLIYVLLFFIFYLLLIYFN